MTIAQSADTLIMPADSRWVIACAALLSCLLIGAFTADYLFNPDKFQMTEIEVHGRLRNTAGNDITRVVEAVLQGNYFSANLHSIERQLEALPWIHAASIRRRWPSTLLVQVTEMQPIADWAETRWLNFNGDLVEREPLPAGHEFADLPNLAGPDDRVLEVWRQFQSWSSQLAPSGLELAGLVLRPHGLWQLELTLGALASASENTPPAGFRATMMVDDHQAGARIERFINALDQQLIARFVDMQSIDLRYPNGFAVRWRDAMPTHSVISPARHAGAAPDSGRAE